MKPEELPERDQFGRLLEDRGVWRQATTLEAAGELTARWLEGGSSYQPGHFAAGYDAETGPIAAALAELNRNGLFTKESQPGLQTGTAAQREYVTGFCSAALAGDLLALSTRTDLVTVAHAPGEASSASIPVTLAGTEVATVLGSSENPVDEAQIRDWADETNDALALLLADSWYVEILDPVWGRNGVLLPAVLGALTGRDVGHYRT
ncbi:DUF6919 domain-containing protein [Arthrobacter nitrophenolicus]|uniref:DUF6919 domain-containing protein n=1 Tax=Arthrobacter nitrophenolicus TaxID=683150 RepID=A0A4R5XVE9_9MICC|nr:hypothetical protein [Arthrobacter nitrophenolicus]TDL35764.1 hypothetical protein E2R57_14535 [Arthrobacter nitrophenolicus]